ncbi:MAG: hypothetical protein HY873_00450 [Chloroflexi bacterium]|nr:hypothetical protein [Chloroflexota bacterium]
MTGILTRGGRTVTLTAHKAILSGAHHGNTIGAVRESLAAGVPRLEIDVHSLDGGDYAVFHERRLEQETDGSGSIGSATPDDIRRARFTHDAGDRPPLLGEVVEAARAAPSVQVQLDLKDWRAMPEDRLRTLLRLIEPVHDQIIISTGQDWNLRRLHRADPDLALGFDPGHYIDYAIESDFFFLPRTIGAYGYRDDHPMALGKTEDVRQYLADRMEMLAFQAPFAREFFLSYGLMLQMLDDGFDVAALLHERGIDVTAWTPDYRGPESLVALDRLMAAGVDRITTNTIPAWTEAAG